MTLYNPLHWCRSTLCNCLHEHCILRNLEQLMDIFIFLHCSTNLFGNLYKRGYEYFTTKLCMSNCQSVYNRQSGFHLFMPADKKALVHYEDLPSSPEGKWGRILVILILCHFCRTVSLWLIYRYYESSTIMAYTGDKWIQLVQLQYVFVLHAIYICAYRSNVVFPSSL